MKKILFGITSLTIGGAERVLVDLANELCNDYNITIFTIYPNGEFEKSLSNKIKLKSLYNKRYNELSKIQKVFVPLKVWINKNQIYNKYIKENFDVEIAFLEGPITRLISVRNSGTKKVAWIHNDISRVFGNNLKSKIKRHIDEKIYNKFDELVFVSKDNKKSFEKIYKNNAVKNVSFKVKKGEIVCIAGIDGNGQTELVSAITGLQKPTLGKVEFLGHDITKSKIRTRSKFGMSHIPEDRHKHGLILDYTLEENLILQKYWEPEFQKAGFIKKKAVRGYAEKLIKKYDIRSGEGPVSIVRGMSGGNQQKAIVAREIDKDPELLVAVQPTRGLDVGAIEYIHEQLVEQRDKGKAVLLVSLELDEVMNLADRILVIYEGEIVGELNPKTTTLSELGLYMAGANKNKGKGAKKDENK